MYQKLIRPFCRNRRYHIEFNDTFCRSATIISIPREITDICKINYYLVQNKKAEYIASKLPSDIKKIYISMKSKADGTSYLVLCVSSTNHIKILFDDRNIVSWSPIYLTQLETIIIFEDKVFAKKTKTNNFYPASVSSFRSFPIEIKNIIFSIYSSNNAWRDFIREDFYIPIKLEEISEYHNKKDYLEKLFNIKLPSSANRVPFKQLYCICCAKDYIYPEQIRVLFSTVIDIDYSFLPSKKRKKIIAKHYLEIWFQNRVRDKNRIISDYIHMSIELKQPIDIMAGKNKICRMHDELMCKGLLKTSKGKRLCIPESPLKYLDMPSNFTLIKTKKMLAKEGMINHNCVFSYLDKINAGRCLIYAADIYEEHLTIEICMRKNGFYVRQCYASYNRNPKRETMEYVEKCIKAASKNALIKYKNKVNERAGKNEISNS